MLRQAIALSLLNLANLRSRIGGSIAVVLGVAGLVFVATALAAMRNGLATTIERTGHADRVLILGAGSTSELNGAITREQAALIVDAPGIAVMRDDVGVRRPLASPEIYASASLDRGDGAGRASLPLRGIGPAAYRVRPEVRIVDGRAFEAGRFEMVAGTRAAAVFDGLQIGDEVSIKGVAWRVVGHFEADGSATESEAWVDVDVMANVFGRGPFLTSVVARLDSPQALGTLTAAIAADRRLSPTIHRESDYYQTQSASSTRSITAVGVLAGVIMALGALFAAVNALYAAVEVRGREIAVLKAIGYGPVPIVTSVMTESAALCGVGGISGAMLGWLAFDRMSMSSVGATFAEVAFDFAVTPSLMLAGVGLALAVALLGAVLPAVSAVRRSVVSGLRQA